MYTCRQGTSYMLVKLGKEKKVIDLSLHDTSTALPTSAEPLTYAVPVLRRETHTPAILNPYLENSCLISALESCGL